MRRAQLEEVLLYKHENLIGRFCDDHGVSQEDAFEIFTETLKWLWLCAHQTNEYLEKRTPIVAVPLLSEVFAVDLMWHQFILFTKDYADFCQDQFGFFIHHVPQTRADKKRWEEDLRKDPVAARRRREEQVRSSCELIYDLLGPQTLSKWMEEVPEKYAHLAPQHKS